MRNLSPYLVLLLPFIGGVCGCHPGETGGEVPDIGHVDLAPPVTYSPRRGVICDEFGYSGTEVYEGICYDTGGPSVALTARYIHGEDAARLLNAELSAGRLNRGEPFTLAGGITCYPDARVCRYGPGFLPAFLRRVSGRYTRALFGGTSAG